MKRHLITIAAACALSTAAYAQTTAELRAQLAETRAMLAQAEAAGMDAVTLASLRESLQAAEDAIREMEAEEAGSAVDSADSTATAQAPYPVKPNLAATEACTGFTEQNYRQMALDGGNDQQLSAFCGQAFEYYTMYKRAIAQGYSESDANRTYDAHEKSAIATNDYYANFRAY